MSEIKLKPCPFCGRQAKIATCDCGYSVKEYWCYCSSCGCETQKYHSKEDVIAQWNERITMSNIVEKLKENSQYCVPLGGQSFTGIKLETAINIVKQEINNGFE